LADYWLGGLVALGIFEQAWSPDQAIQEFIGMSNKAFVPRFAKHVVPSSFLKHQYRTSGIERALQDVFKDNYLFGPPPIINDTNASSGNSSKARGYAHLSRMENVKTGVISILVGLQKPCLIANYSRNPEGEGLFHHARGN
jgi:hypothetical protein